MWFKQIQIFKLGQSLRLNQEQWLEKLEPLAFSPCLPSLPKSSGWVSPVDEEDAPLARTLNGFTMMCMQVEEKILPTTVIRQQLDEKVKKIEKMEDRKCRRKEKQMLQDEVTMTLMPRAFTKLSRYYAYFDNEKQQLVLGTANAKVTEMFLDLFKKCITEEVKPIEVDGVATIMTHWLKEQSYPSNFAIEESCVLQDPSHATRMVRSQQQDLFAKSMQNLIADGYEAIQLSLSWFDRVKFTLDNRFVFRGVKFQEEVISAAKDMDAETKQQQFDADFYIMTETLTALIKELVEAFESVPEKAEAA